MSRALNIACYLLTSHCYNMCTCSVCIICLRVCMFIYVANDGSEVCG